MPRQNRLLAALPDDEYLRLRPHLEPVLLPAEWRLFKAGHRLHCLYFPVDCVVSLFNTLENGAMMESAVVGNEGMLGVNLLLGDSRTPCDALVQTPGNGFRIAIDMARREFASGGTLQRLTLQYMQARMTQMARVALCSRYHRVEQQLCRWLLGCLDRLCGSEVAMTHERLGQVLGVRREGVTNAAGKLQAEGLIEYRRGRISVLDRAKLEARVCECHAVMKHAFDSLLPEFAGLDSASDLPHPVDVRPAGIDYGAPLHRQLAVTGHRPGV